MADDKLVELIGREACDKLSAAGRREGLLEAAEIADGFTCGPSCLAAGRLAEAIRARAEEQRAAEGSDARERVIEAARRLIQAKDITARGKARYALRNALRALDAEGR